MAQERAHQNNADQIAFWGGDAGHTWVSQQDAMDALLQPVLDGVLARADLQTGQHVLDIGCGTGASCLAAGHMVGRTGHVLGMDVSAPMIDQARIRAQVLPQVGFELRDAASHQFDGEYDRLISRFGVMFFEDTRAAFSNMAAAMVPGGRASFATWGQIECNPWFTLPARVARGLFGATPKSDPDAPGPFALRDIQKAVADLEAAGWTEVEGKPQDVSLTLNAGAAAIAELCMHIGPAANTIKHFDLDRSQRAILLAALTDGFDALPDAQVPAQINFFTAKRP